MIEDVPGIGERREASARRKRIAIIAALAIGGFLTGMLVGRGEAKALLDGSQLWSPQLSLGLAALLVIVVAGGSLLLRQVTDELQKQAHYKAGALAGSVFLLVYPLWFLLWKGGFVPEPIHWVLYVLFIFTSLGGLLFYRFR